MKSGFTQVFQSLPVTSFFSPSPSYTSREINEMYNRDPNELPIQKEVSLISNQSLKFWKYPLFAEV